MGYTRPGSADGAASPRIRSIRRVLWVVLALNAIVAVAKLAWGVFSGSVAMQADGIHSLFDCSSNVIGLVGMHIAARPADRDHPYGHYKFESYASAAIGIMLALAAYNIGSSAFRQLLEGAQPPRVTAMSFAIMSVTLAVNLGTTFFERRAARRLQSEILQADASHTASDVIVSLGVIGSLFAVRLGYSQADPIIALGVAVAIAVAAWRVFLHAGETLSDVARIPPADVCAVAREVPGVLGCHHVRTRGSRAEVYMDLHVQVDPAMSVDRGHEVAELVERAICDCFPGVADVIAHLEPYDEYQAAKTAEEIDAGLA
jgi:cation diffusion facilitator family transporter